MNFRCGQNNNIRQRSFRLNISHRKTFNDFSSSEEKRKFKCKTFLCLFSFQLIIHIQTIQTGLPLRYCRWSMRMGDGQSPTMTVVEEIFGCWHIRFLSLALKMAHIFLSKSIAFTYYEIINNEEEKSRKYLFKSEPDIGNIQKDDSK